MNILAGNDTVLWDILISAVIGIPILLYIYRKSTFGQSSRCTDKKTGILLFLAGAGLSLAFRELLAIVGDLGYEQEVSTLLTGNILLEVLVLLILSPLFEELLFRGVIYERLKTRMPIRAAVILSAVFFGLYHGNLSQGIFGFLMGIVLAWAMERYRTVTAPLLIHMGVNAAALLLELVNLL